MKNKKEKGNCNGYYFICRYKGVPVAFFEIELSNGKKENNRFCLPCSKEYIKKHRDSKEVIEQSILVNLAVKKIVLEEK